MTPSEARSRRNDDVFAVLLVVPAYYLSRRVDSDRVLWFASRGQ